MSDVRVLDRFPAPPPGDPPPAAAQLPGIGGTPRPAGPFWTPKRGVLVALLIASALVLSVSAWQQFFAGQAAAAPVCLAVTVFLAVCAFGGYKDGWTWTGIGPGPDKGSGKTLWDTIQLLLLPVMLAFGGLWFNNQQSTAATERSDIQVRNQVLSEYVSQISDLMLHTGLTGSMKPDQLTPKLKDALAIARARTLSALSQLDSARDALVVRFLIESGLIPAVDLSIANLSGVSLQGVDLSGASLKFAWLNDHANLSFTNLTGASLNQAHLATANLSWAHLAGADLSGADLTNTNLYHADMFCRYVSSAHNPGLVGGCRPDNLNLAPRPTTSLFNVKWDHTVCPDGTLSTASKPQTCLGHLRP